MAIDIRPVPVPARLDTAEARPLEAYVDLTRLVALETWGHDHFEFTAAELLVRHRDQRFRRRVEVGAYEGDDLVGAAAMVWESDPQARMAEISLGVRPDRRGRGVGSALLAAMEAHAAAVGRPALVGWSEHGGASLRTTGEVLRAPDGDAELPASDPAARFAVAHGYALQQVERVSGLRVDGRLEEFVAALGEREPAASDAGYRLRTWEDRAPDELADAYAAARARMVHDVPAGGLQYDDEVWTADRVRAYEDERRDSATGVLVAAAVTDAGEVAGYTELELPDGRPIAYQSDTLVVGAHRGHALGMLLKLANLVRLGDVEPERGEVFTWNADENDHMLAINLALGFELRGLDASWQRPASAAASGAAGIAGTGATTGS
ncbi:GNAT superfamily N-acetyltransferase [Agromyces sp. 3263]|uniref:GNAT family N-acetyltransferase n=1 Tax=Agromyces sp. 3263 TaxID=2817750 RepID=UPI00285E7BD4|nr:GNAT family N-acetyltransferase [Agromyces sp. 3263]MDR6907622.1 GNAT superfamily N-acetyltransferase [Agromyces sp. 3263]